MAVVHLVLCLMWCTVAFTSQDLEKVNHQQRRSGGRSSGKCVYTLYEDGIHADCSHRHLFAVPDSVPDGLCSLDFSYNRLTQIENITFAKSMSSLYKLNISHNSLTGIHPGGFQYLTELRELDVSYNHLPLTDDGYPAEVFQPLGSLLTLHTEGNVKIVCPSAMPESCLKTTRAYPDKAMSALISLRELFIDGTQTFDLGPGFQKMTNLRTISIGRAGCNYCILGVILNSTFVHFASINITELVIQDCLVTTIDVNSFWPFSHLKRLVLRNNHIIDFVVLLRTMFPLQNQYMDFIDISGYSRYNTVTTLFKKPHYMENICVLHVKLSENSLFYLQSSRHRLWQCITRLELQRNIQLGLEDLVNILIDARQLNYADFSMSTSLKDVNVKKCTGVTYGVQGEPHGRMYYVMNIKAPKLMFLNFSHNYNLNYNNLKASIQAPKLTLLDVSYQRFDNSKPLSCKTLTSYQAPHLRHLNISGLNCSEYMPYNMLFNYTKLESFHANNAYFQTGLRVNDADGKRFFSRARELRDVSLGENGFLTLPPHLFRHQKQLQYLRLSNNFLRRIPFDLSNHPQLQLIDMSYNQLTKLTKKEREDLQAHSAHVKRLSLFLSGNGLSCGCSSLDFVEWLFSTGVELDANADYQCFMDNGTQTSTRLVWENMSVLRRHCIASTWWLGFAITGCLLISVSILLAALAYRFRWSLKYWYFRIRRKVQYAELEGDDKQYQHQAFVPYSHLDYKWVCGPLLRNLERQDLKLCLHHRDFPVGQYICDNIVDAMNNSRKVVFVVTRNFIKSDWGEFELRMASMRMFQENRNSIVVVFLEDIPAMQMPRSLLDIWRRITCLEWTDDLEGQDVFWDKLWEAVIT